MMRLIGRRVSWAAACDAVGAVAFVVTCSAITWSVLSRPGGSSQSSAASRPAAPAERPRPLEPVSLDGANVEGSAHAAIAVIEYSEFQCPFCGKFAKESLPALKRRYVDSGKVLWAFRHFQLAQIHQHAVGAAVAAECAAGQGRFQQMHDALFAHQQELEAARLPEYARQAGLDMARYSACLTGGAEAKVQADVHEGQLLGVQGTPTFLVGRVQQDGTVKLTKRLFGAIPIATFELELEAQLSAAVPPTW
jgi:protein-disulfide isomerase